MSEGIENLKIALAGAIEFGNAIDKALADDKINLADAALLVPLLPAIAATAKAAQKAGKEIGDLDDAEREQLKVFIKERFDLVDDVLEARLEKGIDALDKIAVAVLAAISAAQAFRG